MMGGLVRNKETETLSKIPGLGDLPLIGGLFRSTSKTTQKVDLVIFITPYVVFGADELEFLTEFEMRNLRLTRPQFEDVAPRIPVELFKE